jgi:hypothetical protein
MTSVTVAKAISSNPGCCFAPQDFNNRSLRDWLETQAWMMDAWIDEAMDRASDAVTLEALLVHRSWLGARIAEMHGRRRDVAGP